MHTGAWDLGEYVGDKPWREKGGQGMGYWDIGVCGVLGGRAQGIPSPSFPPSAGVIITPKETATLPSRSGLPFAFHSLSLCTFCLNSYQEDFLG